MNKINTHALPKGWAQTSMGDIGWVSLGKTPKKNHYKDSGKYKILKFRDILRDKVDWKQNVKGFVCESPSVIDQLQELQKGDILVTASAHSSEHIGKKVAYVSEIPSEYERIFFVGELLCCRAFEDIVTPRIVCYYLASQDGYRSIQKHVRGVHLIATEGKRIIMPLPPLPEQHRIVAKIEELFSELDKGVENLKTAREQLKVYRQSVLKHAFEGNLTEQWRKEHASELEPAEALLKKIKTEREQRYQQQLEEWQQAAKTGKRISKPAKPKELPPLAEGELAKLPKLPEGWGWENLENIVWKIGDVDHRMPTGQDGGIPYISTKDFKDNNCIDFEKAKLISRNDYEKLSLKIKPRYYDLLLSRYGTVGEVRKVTTNREFQTSYSIAIINTINLRGLVDYIFLCLQSEVVQSQIRSYVRATAQPDLGLAHIRILKMPVPPENEQKEIIQQIESRFSVVDQLEQTIDESLQKAEALRQSILKKAFEGKLVSQDHSDEPASVLLERIKAEKAKHSKNTFRRKNAVK